MLARNHVHSGKCDRFEVGLKALSAAFLFWSRVTLCGELFFCSLLVGAPAPPDFTSSPPIGDLVTTEGMEPFLQPITPEARGLTAEDLELVGQGLRPVRDSRDWKRLVGVHSYEGDRWIYQDTRHEVLWELEPRAGYAWRYDSNILETQNNRLADWYETLEAGLHFRLGKMVGKSEDLGSIFALETDYAISQDWFVSNPNQNALNNKGRINLRIGRDDLVIRPYLQASHVTGISSLESELSGRFTSTALTSGVTVDHSIGPEITHHLDYSWGQIDQQSNENVGYSLWKLYHELGFKLVSNEGRIQDPRYTSEGSAFMWGSAQNASANNRSAQVRYFLGGLGTRGTISSVLSYSVKLGWENVERGWDQQVGRDLSSFYLDSNLRYDFNRHFYLELFWFRGYQLSQNADDDNYTDNYLSLGPVFKFDPGWELRPYLSVGTDSTEQNEQSFYFTPSAEVSYIFPNRTKTRIKMKVEYDESRTLHGPGGDVLGWKSTCAVAFDF